MLMDPYGRSGRGGGALRIWTGAVTRSGRSPWGWGPPRRRMEGGRDHESRFGHFELSRFCSFWYHLGLQ